MNIYERKNTELIKEFDRYVREHPEFADDIPNNAVVVMQLEGNAMDCAPTTGDFSPRFEGSATGVFRVRNPHLVFLRG